MMRWIGWPIVIEGSAIGAGLTVFVYTGSPLRPVFAFWLFLFCPGMAFVRLLRLEDHLTELTLAVALSIALSTLISEIMLYFKVWSPDSGLFAVICLSLVGVVFQLAQAVRQEVKET